MRRQLASKSRYTRHVRSRSITSAPLYALLMAGIASVGSAAADAQTISPDMPPPVGMQTTSPPAARWAAIPLGSIEIETPGISPVVPSQNGLTGTCAGSDGAGPSGLFDGGGISGSTSLSCADSRDISSPLPSPSSIGRVGIPLGATEIGGVGISPAAPVTGSGLSGNAAPADGTSTITNSGNP